MLRRDLDLNCPLNVLVSYEPAGAYGYPVPYFMPVAGYGGSDQLSVDMTRVSLSPTMDSQEGDHTVPHFGSPYAPMSGHFVPGPHGSPLMTRSPMQGSPLLSTHAPQVDSRRHHECFMAVPAELVCSCNTECNACKRIPHITYHTEFSVFKFRLVVSLAVKVRL